MSTSIRGRFDSQVKSRWFNGFFIKGVNVDRPKPLLRRNLDQRWVDRDGCPLCWSAIQVSHLHYLKFVHNPLFWSGGTLTELLFPLVTTTSKSMMTQRTSSGWKDLGGSEFTSTLQEAEEDCEVASIWQQLYQWRHGTVAAWEEGIAIFSEIYWALLLLCKRYTRNWPVNHRLWSYVALIFKITFCSFWSFW